MKPDSSTEEMKANSSNSIKCTNVRNVNSTEQTMDSAPDCKFIYSTPQVGRIDNDSQGSVPMTVRGSYSVDSGISDTFNSTWASSINDVSCLECSPESAAGFKRLALKACDCSPIKRVSSCIQGRRLTFTESDFQTVGVPEKDASTGEAGDFCEKSVKYEQTDDLTVNLSDSSPVVCNYQAQSCFRSPDSAIGDELEVSLQDMVLGKFSPRVDCTPPLKSTRCDSGDQGCHIHEQRHVLHRGANTSPKDCLFCHLHNSDSCRDASVDKNYISQASQTETSLLKSSPCWTYGEPKSLGLFDTRVLKHRADAKPEFHSQLSFASVGPQTPQTPGHATTSGHDIPNIADSGHSTAAIPCFPETSPDGELIQTHANFRAPNPSLCQYSLPWSIAHQLDLNDSAMTSNYDNHKGFTHKHSQNMFPGKRSSDCKETSSFPFGPPKVRRTHMLIKDESHYIKIPRKCASRNILLDKKDSSVLDCGTLTVDHLHLYNSNSLQCANQGLVECAESSCDIRLEKPASIWFHSFYGNNFEGIKKEAALDDFTSGDCVKRSIQELEKVCAQESSRIIGRNVGIGKFDIVYELYSQNLHLCLQAIFYHLADGDLASVVAVSTSWKQALYSEHKAYNRYRQHQRGLARSHLQRGSGKENTREKSADAVSVLALTQPKGLLSSMQSQATTAVPDQPPATVAKDVLMCEDTLRVCPRCQGAAKVKPCQDRATCMSHKCAYDFCTLCFTSFHHPRPCKPLCKAPSRGDLAGTKKSKKNLKRL